MSFTARHDGTRWTIYGPDGSVQSRLGAGEGLESAAAAVAAQGGSLVAEWPPGITEARVRLVQHMLVHGPDGDGPARLAAWESGDGLGMRAHALLGELWAELEVQRDRVAMLRGEIARSNTALERIRVGQWERACAPLPAGEGA